MFFRKSCHLFDNVEIDGRSKQATDDSIVRHMPITSHRTEAADTQSESVILIAFPDENG
jgi:hypothetical protein